ncbi:ATR-interacting protein isoform X2 [Callorhinchus milii]|uniref:ATR-interacting protein isoform X2 n=1 Tax=Callorhinchus milii TaxID=7868 RepID=UPI001C3F6CF8|nr:ATR-interacting protein isoform X2 [Callorhinchus milii]
MCVALGRPPDGNGATDGCLGAGTMSANALFGIEAKRRNSSLIYSVRQAAGPATHLLSRSRKKCSDDTEGFPPNKRHKGEEMKADPFEDNEDFTADDLEELDILASQALTQDVQAVAGHMTPRKNDQVHPVVNSNKNKTGSGLSHGKVEDPFGFEVLQEQQQELRQKFDQVQQELQLRNGEVKVLRDSLRRMESDLDKQKRLHLLSEQERMDAQSQRDRELSRKVQSLQSELEFKEAEMIELQGKLKPCERVSKSTASEAITSPRQTPSGSLKPEPSAFPQTACVSFTNRENFAVEVSAPTSNRAGTRDVKETGLAKKDLHKPPSLYSIGRAVSRRRKSEGAVLANLLLGPPVAPATLGLSHLLSNSPQAVNSSVRRHVSVGSSSVGRLLEAGMAGSCPRLQEAQRLAVCGISRLTLAQETQEPSESGPERCMGLGARSWLPAAEQLLPLVDYFMGEYCQALQTRERERAGRSPSGSRKLGPSGSWESSANVDDGLVSAEELALAALGVLHLLVSHSYAAVTRILSDDSSGGPTHSGDSGHVRESGAAVSPAGATETPLSVHTQRCLFSKLLQLADSLVVSASYRRETLINQSLRVLGKLAKNATAELLSRFQVLLRGSALRRCLSADAPCSTVHLAVQLLASVVYRQELLSQLCSQSDLCLFLHLYTYVSTRPDTSATDRLWLQLEQEVVRFLTSICLSHSGAVAVLLEADCQCSTEVLKALIVMMHRRWLTQREPRRGCCVVTEQQGVTFIRETLLLLHRLSQRDKHFTEHCVQVLHQHSQALHGIRHILQQIPDLEESEELALEDLCPHEEQDVEAGRP